MSILNHPRWPEIRPYVRIETYGRDGGPKKPRHRIEIEPPSPSVTEDWLRIEMPCVDCGRPIHPIRKRAPRNNKRGEARHLYFAAACPLSVNYGCCRGSKAHAEYQAVYRDVTEHNTDDPMSSVQPSLW